MALLLVWQEGQSQLAVLALIKAGITKAINLMDLHLQRLQNQALQLQDEEKQAENALVARKLNNIIYWSRLQRDLFARYYQELWLPKPAITASSRVRQLISGQQELLREYQDDFSRLSGDHHFSATEQAYLDQVLEGILAASNLDLNTAQLVLSPGKAQMTDGERLTLIDHACRETDRQLASLQEFYSENIRLSVQRTSSGINLQSIRNLYGLSKQ